MAMNRRWKEFWVRWTRHVRNRTRVEEEARAAMRAWLMV
jgi:hypothetical protein